MQLPIIIPSQLFVCFFLFALPIPSSSLSAIEHLFMATTNDEGLMGLEWSNISEGSSNDDEAA